MLAEKISSFTNEHYVSDKWGKSFTFWSWVASHSLFELTFLSRLLSVRSEDATGRRHLDEMMMRGLIPLSHNFSAFTASLLPRRRRWKQWRKEVHGNERLLTYRSRHYTDYTILEYQSGQKRRWWEEVSPKVLRTNTEFKASEKIGEIDSQPAVAVGKSRPKPGRNHLHQKPHSRKLNWNRRTTLRRKIPRKSSNTPCFPSSYFRRPPVLSIINSWLVGWVWKSLPIYCLLLASHQLCNANSTPFISRYVIQLETRPENQTTYFLLSLPSSP